MMHKAIIDMAAAMDGLAKSTIQWHREAWGRKGAEGYDKSMIDCGNADAADYRQIGAFLRKGKFSAAAKLAYNMDTLPRENIPDKVWNFLETFR